MRAELSELYIYLLITFNSSLSMLSSNVRISRIIVALLSYYDRIDGRSYNNSLRYL